MLLPKDIHPHNSLYYNGGLVLQLIKENNHLSFMEVFLELKKIHNTSMPLFVLTLDWLFLANIISFNEEGNIKLCL